MYRVLALLALPLVVLSTPIDVSPLPSHFLDKRAAVCNGRLGGLNVDQCLGALGRLPRGVPGIVKQFSMDLAQVCKRRLGPVQL